VGSGVVLWPSAVDSTACETASRTEMDHLGVFQGHTRQTYPCQADLAECDPVFSDLIYARARLNLDIIHLQSPFNG